MRNNKRKSGDIMNSLFGNDGYGYKNNTVVKMPSDKEDQTLN